MSKQLALGTFFGLLLTAAVGYYFFVVKAMPLPVASVRRTSAQAEPIHLPMVDIADEYSVQFAGRDDLIAHAAGLHPSLNTAQWDLALREGGQNNGSTRATSFCKRLPPIPGIALPPTAVDAIRDGKQNVVVISVLFPKCIVQSGVVALAYDEPYAGKIAFQVAGQIKVERLLEVSTDEVPDSLLQTMNITRDELPLLHSLGSMQSTFSERLAIMLVSFDPTPPLMRSDAVPGFVGGADILSIDSRMAMLSVMNVALFKKTVLVDTRQPQFYAAGTLNDFDIAAVNAPFIPSNPNQSRFRLDFPLADLAGSSVNLDQIPTDPDISVVLFGHDEHDAGPLWVLRELRRRSNRGIFIYQEGYKKLKTVLKPTLPGQPLQTSSATPAATK